MKDRLKCSFYLVSKDLSNALVNSWFMRIALFGVSFITSIILYVGDGVLFAAVIWWNTTLFGTIS